MAMPAINPYAIQMQQLQRRQALADALMQQSQQPLDTQFTGGANSVAVRRSPFEALAKVAQAAGGAFIQNKNDEKYQDIDTQRQAALRSAIAGFVGGSPMTATPGAPPGSSGAAPTAGTPSDAGVPPAPAPNLPPPLLTNPGYTPPASPQPPAQIPPPQPTGGPPTSGMSGGRSPAQLLSAAQEAINYGADPELIKTYIASQMKPAGNEPNSVREYQFAKTNGFAGSFQDWVAAGGQSSRPSSVQEWEFYNKMPADLQQRYLEMKRNPGMVVKDVAGVPTVVAPRVSGTTALPLSTLSGEASAARTLKQAEAQGGAQGTAEGAITGGIETRGANAIGSQNLLDIADPLIDVATGSTAGAGVDAVSQFFGKSTNGAEAIAKLKVLQAGLMTSMPRMEGPQSDADVKLYREAAGQIGDPTVPAALKKAALQTVRQIQQKYVERASGEAPALAPRGAIDAVPLGSIGGPNSYSRPRPPVPAAPAPQPAAASPLEGRTATGPNGQKLILKGGQWVPSG